MKKYYVIALVCLLNVGAQAQTKQYKEQVREYMQVTGALDQFQSAITQMIDLLKKGETYSEIPDKFWIDFQKETSKFDEDDLIEMFAGVYSKYYSADDLTQIIAFYKTPIGVKLQQTGPAITKDAMAVGEKWGAELGQKIIEKLKKELKNK